MRNLAAIAILAFAASAASAQYRSPLVEAPIQPGQNQINPSTLYQSNDRAAFHNPATHRFYRNLVDIRRAAIEQTSEDGGTLTQAHRATLQTRLDTAIAAYHQSD